MDLEALPSSIELLRPLPTPHLILEKGVISINHVEVAGI